ncbi:fam-a protein [Plasmodium chabaudi chabaudi]|uniref:Fam-a protein n=1 Tax=Plasmodium chabaudi chabaudi TaxID=31271 RepID=A0A077XCG3_PLACU|nr:fam-a protein [Plasmodium chabaudi chabaudi]SCL88864.1 fam-a protein [Plasmodium chabaudi chabaudi]SCL89544.1 fam-a protein [Plasmodium chabaudi chabaudi]VTZ68992.1 fam-a protein [Plasmodium chabaudi chabaudi]|eukprot:XP_016655462.1 fam-a protein [Plasmodium chabaudi chabaudi]
MNKGYIKVVLALLGVAVYMQNMAFASDSTSSENSSNEESEQLLTADSEEVHPKLSTDPEEYEQRLHPNPEENEHLLCTDPEETKQAENVMAEALVHLQDHAKHTDDYYLYSKVDDRAIIHFKNFNGTDIGKLELTILNPNCYDDIINMIWDPSGAKYFDDSFIKGSIFRIYNKNLGIIEQRHSTGFRWDGHYNALAGKAQLSEDTTAIALVSSNINDHDRKNSKNYINPIVESANSFTPEIDSEEDIKKGKLSKTYINLVGFIIKKEPDCVKITYLISIDANTYFFVLNSIIRNAVYNKILDIVKIRDIFEEE